MSNMNTTTTMLNTNTNVFPVKHNTNTNTSTNVFVNDFLRNDFVNKPPKLFTRATKNTSSRKFKYILQLFVT